MSKPKTAINPTREQDFPEWYQQVIKAADMAENSPVRGCMIIKPYGYAVWENMQRIFDGQIKACGVQNAYFPLLIPLEFISREAEHVEGFAKECAVVTHHRLEASENGLEPAGKLEEPYVIRPTSETIIGDSMARWIQSYRDLPLKLNQWCNVMRWEMRTRLFLRTSEFLWQEGHNAFESEEHAREDMRRMLEEYATFAEDLLALPVIRGFKTPDERFPGAEDTMTIEVMMQDGKALQAGTSHYLGQNFAKSADIKFQNREGGEQFVHTTSWGISTRLVGAMIMTHGDDDGMIMPPRVAPYPVLIIPVIKDDHDQVKIMEACEGLVHKLKDQGINAHIDIRDERTPNKMWDAIKKGVPVRVEIGKREVEEETLTHIRRDIGRDSKRTQAVDEFCQEIQSILHDIHNSILKKARTFQDANIHEVNSLQDAEDFYKSKKIGFLKIDKALTDDVKYEHLKKNHAITSRCIPLDDDSTVIIGKAY